METRNDILVITSELNVIKFWKVGEASAQLTNRIHIKEEIASIIVENTNSIVLTLTRAGKIIMLNDLVKNLLI